jgi:hypothetical protein
MHRRSGRTVGTIIIGAIVVAAVICSAFAGRGSTAMQTPFVIATAANSHVGEPADGFNFKLV